MSNKAIKATKPKSRRQKAKETGRDRKINKSPFRILSGIATLAGILGLVTFLPRVTVTVSDPLDPTNPFSATVTVANTGYLPLNSVEPAFGLMKMTFGNPAAPRTFQSSSQKKYVGIANRLWHPSDLGIDDKFAFGMNEIWGNQPNLLTADIAILVKYEIPIIHWERQKIFPLTAVKQTNGRFYWYPSEPGMDKHDERRPLPPIPNQ
jgi:hypothetical protein